MKHVGLSLRLLVRDWSSGEIRVLALAIIIAVASISAVGFFTDRISNALELQANELLGGDLVLTASSPIEERFYDLAAQHQLENVSTVQFPSMVVAGDKHQIAAVKSVGDSYPLRGTLRIADDLFAPDYAARDIPESGAIWAESRLLSALGVAVGDKVSLGAVEFRVAAVITSEPARAGGNLFSLAPGVILNETDLAKTELITPASRVRYSALFAGAGSDIAKFRRLIEKNLSLGLRIQGIDDARPEVKSAVDKAGRFLGLAALVSVILASISVAMAARRFVSRHLDNCAIMRCFGATQSVILRIYTLQMVWLGLFASCIGLVVGFMAQFLLVETLGELAKITLPPPSALPAVTGILVGTITLLGFTFPTLLHLRDVPTLRVLRRELGGLPARSVGTYLLGSFILFILAIWQARDVSLGVLLILGMIFAFLLLGGVAIIVVKLMGRFASRVSVHWRFAINNVSRRTYASVIQIVAFGLGLMVLLILTVVRNDLLAEWSDRIPENTPNRFLINIQPDQVDSIKVFLSDALSREPEIYPMLRARLSSINGEAVDADDYSEDRAKRLVSREFNLSWTNELPPDNTIVKGTWWGQNARSPAFSVEEGLADSLAINLGDELTFDVAGEKFMATVSNIRQVEWDNFRVNFFVVSPVGYLDEYPSTYITSFFLPQNQHQVLNQLLKQFPNVTVIDVAAVLAQVRRIISQVTQAIEYVFIFTLLAGLMVLYAAIHSTLDERMREAAILRTLGATKKQILHGLIVEFTFLGSVAGFVAAIAANAVGALLAFNVFKLDYGFAPVLWFTGLIVGGLAVGFAGVFGARHVLNQPPLVILRGV